MTTTDKTWPLTIGPCNVTTTYSEYFLVGGWHRETVACVLPKGHINAHQARLDDGTDYLWRALI